MRVLLDSQALLLWDVSPQELPGDVRALLEDDRTAAVVSVMTVWELAIKSEKGKLDLPHDYLDELVHSGLPFLGITEGHTLAAARLPHHHRDPVDRMLIAQAQAEGVPIVGGDRAFAAYDVRVIW